ncbi:hypothetical protein GCM10022199_14840 [Marihabitans asiaticum]|uniref:Uncharacterized protein n=1 Tax=Marihabitans asiaticum TaxID=415218 RepID=A0A560W871_9MICO|nr:hypothetical protein [Marihabitans asiaticum]TWD13823.1 hypothetical protein FB557_2463 [Marihabitans asiaticum]
MTHTLIKAHLALRSRLIRTLDRAADERGDVPGWVLITIMTAALVIGLWTIAEDQLKAMFQDALSSVSRKSP